MAFYIVDGFGLLGFGGFNQAVDGGGVAEVGGAFPLVVSTWPFREAVRAAWDVVSAGDGGGSAVDAVVAGCSACEVLRCDGTGQPLARVMLITANGARPQLSLARSRGLGGNSGAAF